MLGLPWNWFGVVRKISFDQDFINDSSRGDEGNFLQSRALGHLNATSSTLRGNEKELLILPERL